MSQRCFESLTLSQPPRTRVHVTWYGENVRKCQIYSCETGVLISLIMTCSSVPIIPQTNLQLFQILYHPLALLNSLLSFPIPPNNILSPSQTPPKSPADSNWRLFRVNRDVKEEASDDIAGERSFTQSLTLQNVCDAKLNVSVSRGGSRGLKRHFRG